MLLAEDQIRRYARHVLLPDVGGTGQRSWLDHRVVIEALEGATEQAVVYLAAAGIGTLVIRDRGRVKAPGWLFEVEDVGQPRLAAAQRRVAALNPDVRVTDTGDGSPFSGDVAAAFRFLRELCR